MAKVRFVLVVILLGVIVIFTVGVTPAHAISCGDVLGPGGNFQLLVDLDCSGTFGTALTVRDGASLDLNGQSFANEWLCCIIRNRRTAF